MGNNIVKLYGTSNKFECIGTLSSLINNKWVVFLKKNYYFISLTTIIIKFYLPKPSTK